MFNVTHNNGDVIFTNDEQKQTIFASNGTIIGVSGKTLKRKPSNLIHCAFAIICNDTFENAKSFMNKHYSHVFTFYNPYAGSNEGLDGVFERILKVVTRKFYDNRRRDSDHLRQCCKIANRYAFLVMKEKCTEKMIIEFINNKGISYVARHAAFEDEALQDILAWHNNRSFWGGLPPIEYSEFVKDTCDYLLNFHVKTPQDVRALQQAVTNGLIDNFQIMGQRLLNAEQLLVNYFKMCHLLEETPNLNGNFITKYSELRRKIDAQQDTIFAKQQNKRTLVFEDENFIVVVPQTIDELIEEGKAQHNCVGHFGYDKEIIEGRSNIVFIRKKSNIKKSFITCEISTDNGDILQYRLKNNAYVNSNNNAAAASFNQKYQNYLHSIW